MLPPDLQKLWEMYLRLESRGCKAERTSALEAFLESVRSTPRGEWVPWAQALARRIVDGGEDIRVRLPFFEHVLFPALMEGRRAGIIECTRWLAHFHPLLFHRPNCLAQLPPDERNVRGMLRAVLRVDPDNREARQQLIKKLADGFDYMLHEVPDGVLYGAAGATETECVELLEDVVEFDRLLVAEGAVDRYGRLARQSRLHVTAYAKYLRSRSLYAGYEAYLEMHHPDWVQWE